MPRRVLVRCTDGGATWSLTSLSPIPGAFYKVQIDRDNPDIVIASGDYGLWRSLDFGVTWTRVYSAGGTTDLVQDPVYHAFWYAGAPGIGVLESSDHGVSFHPINTNGGNGITDPVGRISIAVSDAAPNYVYAVAEGSSGTLGGIYRSSNYGYDWVRIDSVDMISWGQAFHTTAIAVDPATPDRLFVGMGGVQWTANATAASPCWTRNVGTGCTGCSSICVDGGHADFTGFLFTGGASPTVLMTNDGGLYSYNWSTNTISGALNLVGLNAMQSGALASARLDPETLVSGLQDNGMVRSGPSNWTFLGGGDGGPATISPDNTTDFFFSSGAAFYRYFSTNRGDSWTGVNCTFPTNWAPTVLRDPTPGVARMYTHTDDFLWSKPVSAACDWARINTGHPLPAGFAVKAIDANNNPASSVFYATAWSSGALYVLEGATLGALTPVNRTPPLPPGSTMADANVTADRSSLQPNTAYYVTGAARPSRAYLTTNRGVTWQDVTGDLTTVLPGASYQELIALPSNLNELYLATDQGVYRSDNRGAHWYRFMDGLPQVVNVTSVELNYDGQATPVMHIGTYGRGYWKRSLPQ